MVVFPLADAVERLEHGTACHWTARQPMSAWPPPIFRATHGFVLAHGGQTLLAAIYHQDVPAWAVDEQGALIGCLLRNTPGMQRGASGHDLATHTLHYALRVPSQLGGPASCRPHAEAAHFCVPPDLTTMTGSAGPRPETFSLASIRTGAGMITAAKASDTVADAYVLRLYQPSNAPQTLDVSLGSGGESVDVTPVTALEDPLPHAASAAITPTKSGFRVSVNAALTSVSISSGSQAHSR
jgi:alpha-mannosidase